MKKIVSRNLKERSEKSEKLPNLYLYKTQKVFFRKSFFQ